MHASDNLMCWPAGIRGPQAACQSPHREHSNIVKALGSQSDIQAACPGSGNGCQPHSAAGGQCTMHVPSRCRMALSRWVQLLAHFWKLCLLRLCYHHHASSMMNSSVNDCCDQCMGGLLQVLQALIVHSCVPCHEEALQLSRSKKHATTRSMARCFSGVSPFARAARVAHAHRAS